jgi:hypothetical protein
MYDFLNDGDFPDDERVPYKLILWELFDCYYTYCRSHMHSHKLGKGGGWSPNEHEIGYAYEQCESIYKRPVERLMFEVLTLVLNAGRGPATVEPYHRAKIAAILAEHDLGALLKTLHGKELQEFTRDLDLLGLLG